MASTGKHTAGSKYIPGDHWITCQRCGMDIRSSAARREWTGLKVCADKCWEPRHPQDFVKAIKEDTAAKGLVTSDFNRSGDVVVQQDNTSPTLTLGTDNGSHEWYTALTANRTITLALSGDDYGRFTIYRTAGGSFTLDVGGLKTIPADINAVVEVEYRSGAWHLIDYYTLG